MNNNIITATPPGGSPILPFNTNIIQTQQTPQPHPSQYNGNSYIQLMPTQLTSGPLIAGNLNMRSSECGTKLGSPISNIPSGDNSHSTLTFMPQMAFITSGVGSTTQLSANMSDLNSLQQTVSSTASPMISVITNTYNTANNQHNTSFLIPSGVPNNSILSTSVGVTPINLFLTNNASAGTINTNNIGNAIVGAGGKPNITSVMEMKSNPVIPASVLLCNRPPYHLQGSNKPTDPTTSRNNVLAQHTPLTVINPELVKQIVVGNQTKNSVITHSSARNVAFVTSNQTQTLLKSTSVMTNNIAPMKPTNSSKKSTTLLNQPTMDSTKATGTMQTVKKHAAIPQPTTTNTLQKTPNFKPATNILPTPANTSKIPLSEAAKAVAIASSTSMTQVSEPAESNADGELKIIKKLNSKAPECVESIPTKAAAVSSSIIETTAIQANISVIKATSALNHSKSISKTISEETTMKIKQQSEDGEGPIKVDCNSVKALLVQTKLLEKQESLLKVRPVQNIIECNTSPRSKRSKSLSTSLKEVSHADVPTSATTKPISSSSEHVLAERRHSTASDGRKLMKHKSPPRRKQSLTVSKRCDVEKDYEIIDLIDYNEEEQKIIRKQLTKVSLAEEKGEIEIQKEDAKNVNNEQKSSALDVKPSLSSPPSPQLDTNLKLPIESNEGIELIEGSSIKIEIVMESDESGEQQQQQTKQQAIDNEAENEDLIFQDTKVEEDTQASVEHTQESIEKSLYCDEKISISSTSTSSSRQSLHDDLLIAPSSSSGLGHNQNVSSKFNQKLITLSTAAGIVATKAATSTINSTTEDALSCALKMLANFNMLTWHQRVGSARGTNMRFQLNEFNFIEIKELCSPRTRIHTAYEKPVYERESVPNFDERHKNLLYLCRRCNCHGPAIDFLAPQFCSLDCLKRDSRKRRHEEYSTSARKRKTVEPPPLHASSKKSFRWSTYLPEKFNAIAAPVNLFINPFPTGSNRFQIGMKLEAIDPENCSLFCVCTIVDIQGYRLRLTFDGYEYMYDFWVNADSMDIFPPGWCAKTKRILQPPKGTTVEEFSWSKYLAQCKAIAAQRVLFTHLNASLGTHNPFKIGMHLEAEDLNDTGKLCVASVADVLDNRIRVHFDGWDDCYDYWVDISSPYIHPCGWHVGRHQLIVPPEFENATFLWTDYIKNHGSGMTATEEMFSTRDPIDFKPNMKLEVVDPRNPSLIRPATVVGRKGHRVKLHLDCWASNYCFWLEDDSADLHPIGWCEATGHDLEPPPGYKMRTFKIMCATYGCRGIGNAKRLYLNTHSTRDCCPYSPDNWRQKSEKPPRLEHDEIIRALAGAKRELAQNKSSLQWEERQQQQQQQQQRHQRQQQQPPLRPQQQQQHISEGQILQQIQLLDNIKTRHVIQQEKQLQKQQQQTTHQKIHGNRTDIAPPTTQQKPKIKSEPTDMPITSTLKATFQPGVANTEESTSLLLPQIKIAKEFLYDYGPRLQQNYNIWQRNVAFDMQRIKRNPLLWSTKDTCAFVQCVLRNSDTTETFLREDIDGNALLLLQQSDLTEILKLKLGPAVKLFSCILQLRTLTAVKFDIKLRNASK